MFVLRIGSSVIFLLSIIISIPLAFDVGGRTCGLAYSLSLSTFYFCYSVLRILTPEGRSRFRWALVNLLAVSQWLLVPGLLIWSLNRFSVDSGNTSGSWVERTFDGAKRAVGHKSVGDRWFGHGGLMEDLTIGSWDKMLRWSTPVFQLCEGFCSLLVIQAAGQISRWLVNRTRSDSWMIGLLVLSASIISSSVYFLWRITRFPEIGNVDATLIGMTITCALFLGAWGIGSGRGNPVESSLLFAYTVLCIYQIFTDYLPSHPVDPSSTHQPPPDFPPFPPIVMASYTTLLHALSTLPTTIHSAFTFTTAAFSTITPSVIISLAYRLFVLYASTRIIPAVHESGARALSQEASLEDSDGASRLLGLLSWFSPSILIAVYTSLLMQHFASPSSTTGGGAALGGVDGRAPDWWTTQGGGEVGNPMWRWANVGGTMALYALELYLGKEDYEGGVTGHWKAD